MKLDPIENAPDWLKRDPKTGLFYVSKYRADLPVPRIERKLKNPNGLDEKLTVAQAKRIGEEIISKWIAGALSKKVKTVSIATACKELLSVRETRFLAGKIRKRTFNHDKSWIPLIAEWFGKMDPNEITEEFWESWHETTGRELDRTLADAAKYLSLVLDFCQKRKWIARKPMIRNLDESSYKGRVYTEAETAAIFTAADDRLKVQMTLGYECGMRTHEIRELKWSMVSFGDAGAVIALPAEFSKTGIAREFLVSGKATEALRELATSKEGPFVFPSPASIEAPESDSSFYARFRAAVSKAEVTGRVRFYDLRHTFFNRLVYEQGADIELVSEYAGNSPATIRKNYLERSAKNTVGIAGRIGLKRGD